MLKLIRSPKGYLIVSLLFAFLGSIALYGYLHGLDARVAQGGMLMDLLIAKTNIRTGEVIVADMLEMKKFPENYFLNSMLSKPEEALGRIALHDIVSGDPVLDTSLSMADTGGRVALMLPEGRRGYPLAVQENTVSLNDLSSGDRVDVIFVPAEGRARTLLHSIPVLSRSARTSNHMGNDEVNYLSEGGANGGDAAEYVILSVTREEAEILAEAEEKGRIILAVCPLKKDAKGR